MGVRYGKGRGRGEGKGRERGNSKTGCAGARSNSRVTRQKEKGAKKTKNESSGKRRFAYMVRDGEIGEMARCRRMQ